MMGGLLFSATLVLVLIAIAYLATALIFPSRGHLPGFWTTPTGETFEVVAAAGGDFVISSSGAFGAEPGKRYPVTFSGLRRVAVLFPRARVEGYMALDRRRILWAGAPVWLRQGV